MLISAIRYRNEPDAIVLMVPSACRAGESSSASAETAWAPATTSIAITKTIVECPMANQNPTDFGRLPSFISLRVVLSIAAM